MIDEKKCEHVTIEQLEEISIIIHAPEYLCTEKAIQYMRLSRVAFFEYVKIGIIEKPVKPLGLSNKLYLKSGLDRSLEKIKSKKK